MYGVPIFPVSQLPLGDCSAEQQRKNLNNGTQDHCFITYQTGVLFWVTQNNPLETSGIKLKLILENVYDKLKLQTIKIVVSFLCLWMAAAR